MIDNGLEWGIADEYLEEQQKEFENNNVEFLRNKVARQKEVIENRDKEIEILKSIIQNTYLDEWKCGSNTYKQSWEVSKLKDKMLDDYNKKRKELYK